MASSTAKATLKKSRGNCQLDSCLAEDLLPRSYDAASACARFVVLEHVRVAGPLWAAGTLGAAAVSAAHVREPVHMAGPSEAVWGCGASEVCTCGELAADGEAPGTPEPGTLGAAALSAARACESAYAWPVRRGLVGEVGCP